MNSMPRILIIDDEPQIRRILGVMLAQQGFEINEAESGEQAITLQAAFQPNVALIDINLPVMDGLATLKVLLSHNKDISCIMMTAYGTIRSAIEAMRIGAFDYLTKPFDNDELLIIIRRALEMRNLSHEVEELRAELSVRYGFNEIVGISSGLQTVFRTMTKVAPLNVTVLIEGESGTGKELVARAMHRRSPRAKGPFVAVNCGAIPQPLFEAEFFGYERGAFTDAREARAGRFEQAQHGTLFLDEIGDLSLDAQVKLLRAVQDREVTRLGSSKVIKVDARVIAATNMNLEAAVLQGKFREDLYWRLNVIRLGLPSLRERRVDIPLIIDHLLDRFNRELNLAIREISKDALQLLKLYDWPGNVRELENALYSAMVMCDGDVITASDLPPRIRGEAEGKGVDSEKTKVIGVPDISKGTLAEVISEATEKLERRMIISRLAEMRGNRTETAESLGINRRTLFNKIREYGLKFEDGGDAI